MIKYALCCADGHAFEAWFRSGDAYDRQAKKHLVSCPQCGSKAVEKQPMAPALLKGRRRSESSEPAPAPAPAIPETPAATAVAAPAPVLDLLRAFKRHVVANSEDVGNRFAEEALRIHHGETEERAIRGETTHEDALRLQDEGIDFGVLPVLPEERN
jgi:hypothetical protein